MSFEGATLVERRGRGPRTPRTMLRAVFGPPDVERPERLPFLWSSPLLLIPAIYPLSLPWLSVYALALAYAQFVCFQDRILLRRRVFFETYVDSASGLRRFSRPGKLALLQAGAAAGFFSIYTTIVLFTFGAGVVMALAFGAVAGSRLGAWAADAWLRHARAHFRPLLRQRWITSGALCGAAVLFVAAELAGSAGDYGGWDGERVEMEMHKIDHPVPAVQRLARGVEYANITLLRCRDRFVEVSPYAGWTIYLFFVLPNLLPIFGVVAGLQGISDRYRAFRTATVG